MSESNSSAPPLVELEPHIMRFGLKRIMARSSDLVLCVISQLSLRLIGISSLRLMTSWECPITGPISPRFFVIPRIASQVISSMVSQELTKLTLNTIGAKTILGMYDRRGQYEFHWKADLRQFIVPPEFTYMCTVPQSMITTDYLALSDAAHQAVAGLANLHGSHGIPKEKLAILVDFGASHLALDGRTIIRETHGTYYFDPRLLIRAMETIKSRQLQIGITPLRGEKRGVLTLLATQDGWHVQCALLSIGLDTQKLYPLPSEGLGTARG